MNSNTLVNVGAGSLTVSGVISGGKSLTMSGAGTLVLSNANTYTGGTTINSGVLQVTNNLALNTAALTFAGNGNLQTGAAGLVVANPIVIASGAIGMVDTQAQTLTLSGVISSTNATGGLTKIGAGKLILTGTSTLTNTLTVNAGTLQVGDGVTNGSFNNATVVDNATLAYNLNANATVRHHHLRHGHRRSSGQQHPDPSGATSSYSGGLTVTNGGTVILAGGTGQGAAGTGNATLNNGTLTLNNSGTGTTFGNNLVVPAGATGTFNNVGNGNFSGAVFGSGVLNFVVQSNRGAIAGDWSAFNGTVNISGAGDFRISAGSFNAPNAIFTLAAGSNLYELNTSTSITLGDLTGAGAVGGASQNNILALNVGSAETAGVTSNFSGSLTDAAGPRSLIFTKNGPGTLDLSGNITEWRKRYHHRERRRSDFRRSDQFARHDRRSLGSQRSHSRLKWLQPGRLLHPILPQPPRASRARARLAVAAQLRPRLLTTAPRQALSLGRSFRTV